MLMIDRSTLCGYISSFLHKFSFYPFFTGMFDHGSNGTKMQNELLAAAPDYQVYRSTELFLLVAAMVTKTMAPKPV
jgi:hypothetical protein